MTFIILSAALLGALVVLFAITVQAGRTSRVQQARSRFTRIHLRQKHADVSRALRAIPPALDLREREAET